MNRFRAIASAAVALAAQTAYAQTTNWTNPAGGTFATPTNWSAVVPNASTRANFSLAGAYTIAFDANASAANTAIETGVVTFDLTGREYTSGVLSVVTSQGAVVGVPTFRLLGGRMTAGSGSLATNLEIRNAGQLAVTGSFTLGRSMSVVGTGSTFTGPLSFGSGFGGASPTGSLTLSATDGGSISTTTSLVAADTIGTSHSILVDGTNSLLTSSGMTLATAGAGNLTISRGGVVRGVSVTGAPPFLRSATASTGSANITVDGGTLSFSEIALGGTSASSVGSAAGTAYLLVKNGGVVETTATSSSNNALGVSFSSTVELDGGTLRGGSYLFNAGAIRGAGTIAQSFYNATTGRITVAAGRRLRGGGLSTSWMNGGIIAVDDGTQLETTYVGNDSPGLLTLRNGATLDARTVVNNGAIAITAGHVDVMADVTNTSNSNAVITLSNNSSVTFYEDVTNSGRINLGAGSSATFLGAASGPGTFTGTGTAIFEGDLRPGASPARVSFGGNVAFGSGSNLQIELGGKTRGTQYDALDVAGTLGLNGEATITTLNGFVPLPGDAFEIARFGGRDGDVAIVNETGFAGLKFVKQYDADSLTLLATGTAGDANLDGAVNFQDLVVLAQNYNLSGNWLDADFNGDGAVNFMDLVPLAQNYNKSASLTADWTRAQAIAVPEPATLAAACVLLPLLTRGRRGAAQS